MTLSLQIILSSELLDTVITDDTSVVDICKRMAQCVSVDTILQIYAFSLEIFKTGEILFHFFPLFVMFYFVEVVTDEQGDDGPDTHASNVEAFLKYSTYATYLREKAKQLVMRVKAMQQHQTCPTLTHYKYTHTGCGMCNCLRLGPVFDRM